MNDIVGALQERRHRAVAGDPHVEGEAELLRSGARFGDERVVLRLREVEHLPVIAEIYLAKLRMPVEPEALDHQPVEMAHEIIGEEERADLVLHHRRESVSAGEEFIAMRARDPLDALFSQHAVEFAARAAVAVEAEDVGKSRRAGRADFAAHAAGDFRGRVVPARGQACDVKVSEAVRVDDLNQFAPQRAAGDDQRLFFCDRGGGARDDQSPFDCAEPWRRAIMARAVSTATAASRQ